MKNILFLLLFFFSANGITDDTSSVEKAESIGKQIRSHWQQELPLDENALTQNGIRKIQGKQITLYTDLPGSKEIDELPEVFAQFLPLCCRFFELNEKNYAGFHLECFLIGGFDKFKAGGAVSQVPKLKNGYALRCRIWLREQKNPYYLRHLFLHECVHALLGYAFGHWGPPWYREGTAELLATHSWENGKLSLGIFPKEPADFPRWGRIEYIRQSIGLQNIKKVQQFKRLDEVFSLAEEDYNENESYAWSWAFAAFCANHSAYREAFRQTAFNLSEDFNKTNQRFLELVRENNPSQAAIDLPNDWLDFQRNICYGYDFKRMKIDYPQKKLPVLLKANEVSVKANGNWQSSGLQLEKGKRYIITAAGHFQIGISQLGNKPGPYFSEPNGITVKYYNGEPLGKLLAAVIPERELLPEEPSGIGFHHPLPVGLKTEWTAPETGVLFFRINDIPSELEDNEGIVNITVLPTAEPLSAICIRSQEQHRLCRTFENLNCGLAVFTSYATIKPITSVSD